MLVIRRATDHVILNFIVQGLSPLLTGKNACIHCPTERVSQVSRTRRSDVRFFFFCVLRRPWRFRLASILNNLCSRRDLKEFTYREDQDGDIVSEEPEHYSIVFGIDLNIRAERLK